MNCEKTFDQISATLAEHDQSHLIAHWDKLNDTQREELLTDIGRINFAAVGHLIETQVRHAEPHPIPLDITPAPYWPAQPDADDNAGHGTARYAEGVERGVEIIKQNQVGVFTVAGGQGTRLGFDGPKGAYCISPIENKPLFQLFAENILGTNTRYGSDLTWYVMTSPQNDAETQACFADNDYFGLKPERVRFFQQGVMPAFAPDGKILLDEPHRIAFSPDGHGGSLLALRTSGVLDEMREAGVKHISYFQVDNPLVMPIDPLFIGLHDLTGSEMSSKTIPKADDLERVGNFVVSGDKMMVIEYSDFPEELARSRDDQGNRLFDSGSIAIHVLSCAFVEKLTADAERFALPWHRASKKVAYIDNNGERVVPDAPNAVKLESFIFDALPLANNPLILQTTRAGEFSPVKNATGVDSAETARRDMVRRAAAWLTSAGVNIPRTADGEPDGLFEISPEFALDGDHLCEVLSSQPVINARESHYWE